jgi:hypothetical protein
MLTASAVTKQRQCGVAGGASGAAEYKEWQHYYLKSRYMFSYAEQILNCKAK